MRIGKEDQARVRQSQWINFSKTLVSWKEKIYNLRISLRGHMDNIAGILKKKTGKFLSIDFGRSVIKIVYLEFHALGCNILKYDLKEISRETPAKEAALSFIKDFVKNNSISTKNTYLTLSDPESIIIKHMILPGLPKDEVLEAAKWQIKEEMPFGLDEGLFDWQLVKEYTDADGVKKNQIVIIAAKKELIQKYLALINECGLSPVSISSNPFNYANILKNLENKKPLEAILDIGSTDAFISIFHNSRLAFMRRLSFSSSKLTQSLAGGLVWDKGKIELTPEKALALRNKYGIPLDSNAILDDGIPALQIISLMRPILEVLIREIKVSLNYFAANLSEEGPGVLYLTGGGANLKNLDTYLAKQLNIDTGVLPFPHCVQTESVAKEKLDEDKNHIISAVAAVLSDSDAINLVPPEIKSQKVEAMERISLRLVSLAAGVIFLFLFFAAQFQIRDYNNRLKNAKAQWKAMEEIKTMREHAASREGLIAVLQGQGVPVDGLLKVVSSIIPSNVILDELSLDQSNHTLILKGVVSAGEELSGSVLTNLMQKIEASPFFKEASLVFSNRMGAVQSFQIKCDLAR